MTKTVLLEGVGAYGPGFSSWPELECLLNERQPVFELPENEVPAVELMSAIERRRAPLLVKYGIEVATQAVRASGRDPTTLATVFASAMGDVSITDYMCRELCSEQKFISPTHFHNSVHNAPAGYWSIAAKSHEPSSSISAFADSFAASFLESAAQAIYSDNCVLCVVSDIAVREPMDVVYGIRAPAALAFVIAPATARQAKNPPLARIQFTISVLNADHEPDLSKHPLEPAMALLAMIGKRPVGTLTLSVGARTALQVQVL